MTIIVPSRPIRAASGRLLVVGRKSSPYSLYRWNPEKKQNNNKKYLLLIMLIMIRHLQKYLSVEVVQLLHAICSAFKNSYHDIHSSMISLQYKLVSGNHTTSV